MSEMSYKQIIMYVYINILSSYQSSLVVGDGNIET